MVTDFAPTPIRSSRSVLGRLPSFPGFLYELRGYWDGRPTFSYMSSTHYITGHDVSHWSADYASVSELIHPDDIDVYDDMRMRARAGDPEVSAEYRERTLDGHYIWVREVARRGLDDAGSVVLTGMCVDVTAIRARDATVLERERRLRALMETAAAHVLEFDQRGRLVYASHRTVGGVPSTMFADPREWLGVVSDDDRDRVRQVVLDAFQRRTGCDVAFRVVSGAGLPRTIRFVLTYSAGELGAPGWIAVLTDVSAQDASARRARIADVQTRAVTERTGATVYRWRRGTATAAFGDRDDVPLAVHRDDVSRFHAVHRGLVMARGHCVVDFRWRDDADEWRWVRATARSVGDGMSAFGAFLPHDDAVWREREIARVTDALTLREREVLALLSEGLTNRELARELFLTEKTASHHVANVLEKLGLANRASAAAFAVRLFER
jgi:DNA-binding CsgD family transcriptional regulator/PAS domain-containing protein